MIKPGSARVETHSHLQFAGSGQPTLEQSHFNGTYWWNYLFSKMKNLFIIRAVLISWLYTFLAKSCVITEKTEFNDPSWLNDRGLTWFFQEVPQTVSLCKKCVSAKPPRTHHCSVCKMCVLKMDHHCRILGKTSRLHEKLCFYLLIVRSPCFIVPNSTNKFFNFFLKG